jgi:hypothetical protein
MVKRQNRLMGLFCILAIALLVTACGGGAPANTSNTGGGDPAAGAKAFFDALYAGNSVDSLICTSAAETAAAIKSGMQQMRDMMTAQGATVDASGLTYTVSNQTADAADVTVAGNLKVTAAGASTDTPFPATPVKMRNEGGSWKVCG